MRLAVEGSKTVSLGGVPARVPVDPPDAGDRCRQACLLSPCAWQMREAAVFLRRHWHAPPAVSARGRGPRRLPWGVRQSSLIWSSLIWSSLISVITETVITDMVGIGSRGIPHRGAAARPKPLKWCRPRAGMGCRAPPFLRRFGGGVCVSERPARDAPVNPPPPLGHACQRRRAARFDAK
jgi:hypothetical protein